MDKRNYAFGKANFLLLAIGISVYQFGGHSWRTQKQVALILPGVKENLGWDRSQYVAVKSVCEEADFSLVLRENIPDDRAGCKKVVDELVKRGGIFANLVKRQMA